ncbi:DUF3077 domain-containing protein [Pseudomonas sp. LS1212]|uniref:DUF3077 domain-containing protein n=1 Tax=Pseudomonas sp. LS1212 TaxID=2972478 RepID=UPI00215B7E51|nr:DUF3077 domain-containing protein [Pseudomonas sp. LS1212]UVJ44914.1 DUF3077 domain-containing protein [Pseudomonas sp. LS1212]
MIKIVPDPPTSTPALTTIEKPFGTLDSNGQPLFAVRAGIPAEDALLHATTLIECAEGCARPRSGRRF